jgi:hypothetical protein
MHRRDWFVLIVLFNISLKFVGLQIIDEQVNNLESYVIVILWYRPFQPLIWMALMFRSGMCLSCLRLRTDEHLSRNQIIL